MMKIFLKYSYEYLQLIKDLFINNNQLKLKLSYDQQFNIIKHIDKLIENHILIINKQTELLNLFFEQVQLKQIYKSILIPFLLNGY
ncbi:unnamed protein product [Rotaria sordida]|uniref:Uncharacterized protein n=1 Tax=Rotaria sordida TaxID=392033 RepID=A0A816DTB6_9BILA|nr:unnamed protein product [Rotaria sordida]CAF1640064.1 unnamed protein product [Rotaria sordida]